MLTSDSPPPYSEAVGSAAGREDRNKAVSTKPLVDQVVVTRQEVEQTLARHAPHLELTSTQKDTIKRLTESLLKRNVREQGVLPTSQQKEFTLEHVVAKFDKRSGNSYSVPPIGLSASANVLNSPIQNGPQCPYPSTQYQLIQTLGISSSMTVIDQTGQNGASLNFTNVPRSESNPNLSSTAGSRADPTASNIQSRVAQQAPQPIHSITTRPMSGHRLVIGEWGQYTVNNGPLKTAYAYDDQIPKAIVGVVIIMLLSCVLATPLTLLFTIPTLHWLVKVKREIESENIAKAKKYFKKFYRMSICTFVGSLILFIMTVTIIPLAVVFSVTL